MPSAIGRTPSWGGLGRHFELESDGEDDDGSSSLLGGVGGAGAAALLGGEPFSERRGAHGTTLGGAFGTDPSVDGLLFMDLFKGGGDAQVDIESIAMMGLEPE